MENQGDELHEFLQSLELLQYYEAFRREGFERLESIAEIQETDFEALGVKRGHRRFIQRRALEIVQPLRYSRELPPINQPLLVSHHLHQSSLDLAPSPSLSLDEIEPLTVYLHRPHPHHSQPQNQPPPQQQQRSQQQSPAIQPPPPPPPPPLPQQSPTQSYYSQPSYYYRHYSPQSRQTQQAHYHRPGHQQQPTSQPHQRSRPTYTPPSRLTVPFPKPSTDEHARNTPNPPVYSPIPAASSSNRPQLLPTTRSPGSHSRPGTQGSAVATPTQGGASLPQHPPPKQFAAPSYPTSEGRPVSTSAEEASPQKTRAPTSPFSGPFQHITPLATIMQSPQMRHRTRGQSISSAVASTSSSRRRDSRADAKSPYSRPPTDPDPQSPRSPKSPVSPQSPKRTYRRHPKKDPNAPEKWRSAYQLFRDDVNRELQGQDIPFSEMSKIHSKRWTQLSSDERATYVERSKIDKQEYKQKMELYERTLEFKQYEEYLDQFYRQESTVNRVGRPKGTQSSKSKGKRVDGSASRMEESRDDQDMEDIMMDRASSSPSPSHQHHRQHHLSPSPE